MYPYSFRIQCNLFVPCNILFSHFVIVTILYCVEVRSSEPIHTIYLLFHHIYLKDVLRWNICIAPAPSFKAQSHIVLTLVTLCVACLYTTLVCAPRDLCLFSEIQREHINTLMTEDESSQAHINVHAPLIWTHDIYLCCPAFLSTGH